MTMTRALSKATGRVLIGVLLFAQFAVASYACPGLSGMTSTSNRGLEAAVAVASPQDETSTPNASQMAPGCEQMDQDAANLCVEHCRHGQQHADTATAPVTFATIPALLYSLPIEPARRLGSGRSFPAPDASLAAAPPPPHAILHCVFRI